MTSAQQIKLTCATTWYQNLILSKTIQSLPTIKNSTETVCSTTNEMLNNFSIIKFFKMLIHPVVKMLKQALIFVVSIAMKFQFFKLRTVHINKTITSMRVY